MKSLVRTFALVLAWPAAVLAALWAAGALAFD